MVKFLVVIGTRPEAIKLAPVIGELRRRLPHEAVCVCSTGQHREMLAQALSAFAITPDLDLELMQPDQGLSALSARVLVAMDAVLTSYAPEWVIVQGDTTTVAMAAIAANHRRVKVAHVEAGLRTYDRANPFPEEMNRVMTDHMSELNFAPTSTARQNLLREGIEEHRVVVVGNTVIDALYTLATQPWQPDPTTPLAHLPDARQIILVTAHRRENFGAPLAAICTALQTLAKRYGDKVHIVYPVHRNPHVWSEVHARLANVAGITLLPPLDYRALIHLMKRSWLILTDSGGIQEEAPALGKPVLVLRTTTERPEAVAIGAAQLIGTDADAIAAAVEALLYDENEYVRMATAGSPYGDGHAAARIVDCLLAQSGAPVIKASSPISP
ncbi:MAG TPA: UDP-N-acetylglucosamine 2-epimerase (non-hydrolyzing) [Chloroflexi bacterium]|nr:UDP-N-acetylglucosamine 2-epimerase (non-hydrolyzing) [Chloroflexota bacterium]HHW85386.1 UDP-N-acetylglucosamine 2-epimerase (non-hydrolyzing) [Chloroflexota bacterium]